MPQTMPRRTSCSAATRKRGPTTKARQAGVTVIALDTPTDPESAVDAFYATDNAEAGKLIGRYAKARADDEGMPGGSDRDRPGHADRSRVGRGRLLCHRQCRGGQADRPLRESEGRRRRHARRE